MKYDDKTPRLRGRKHMERRKRWLLEMPLCVLCQAEKPPRITPTDEFDHVIPLSQGGADDETNIRPLCHEHHLQVTREQFGYREKHAIGLDGFPIE